MSAVRHARAAVGHARAAARHASANLAVSLAACLALAGAIASGHAAAGPVEEGRLYLRGSERVAADPARALQLFRGAAQRGDPQAAYYLGMMYQSGMAVARDMQAAAHWLRFAASRQNPAAMYALAKLYLAGEGVPRDEQAARRWIEKAADLDYPEAVMTMAIGLRDGSMGFERNEALAETQLRFAQRALKQATPGM
ncbi:hypothetical protein FHW58_001556 [Duganella sp. 1224]|uniref:tetratricopeptide repeat protein n=1 Tax=Duganella sp. 1224 TaxID=2587052 RepID=UPI0015CE0FC7|nr:tetratricopeptide repeat protein [Duganella sp. 1224]NYE60404.1 hypothetical protein [Duganella sp. 1224]